MKLTQYLLLSMTFILFSCQEQTAETCTDTQDLANCTTEVPDSPKAPEPEIPETEAPEPEVPETETPKGVQFSTKVKYFNFDERDRVKVDQALKELIFVVKSQRFKTAILTYTYNGEETFADNGGLSNAEIYQSILAGAEKLLPVNDGEMDLELQLYYKRFSGVVGYTYPSKLRIYMNTKFFDNFDSEQVANNVMHEWLHKLGYKHDSNRTSKRPYTVPYAVGNLMQNLIVEFRQRGEL